MTSLKSSVVMFVCDVVLLGRGRSQKHHVNGILPFSGGFQSQSQGFHFFQSSVTELYSYVGHSGKLPSQFLQTKVHLIIFNSVIPLFQNWFDVCDNSDVHCMEFCSYK